MIKLIVLLIILSAFVTTQNSAKAVDFPSFGPGFGSFPSVKPFPTKTPKPSETPSGTSSPTSTPAPTPTSNKFEILDIEPASANYMQEFTIYGSNFGSAGSVNFRYYNQNYSSGGATIISWTNSEIKAAVPALKKGSYRIQIIRSDGQKSEEEKFSVKNGQPVMDSNSIKAVNGKFELTFQGQEFGRRGSIDIYNGGGLAGKGVIKYWSSSKIRFDLPALPRAQYGFQITTQDGRKSPLMFFTVGN